MGIQRHIQIWNECLGIIENILDERQFASWFKPIKPVSINDSVLTVEVPSHFFSEYLDSTYLDLIKKTLRRVIGSDAKLFYQVRVLDKPKETMTLPLVDTVPPTNGSVSVPLVTPADRPSALVYPGIKRVSINPQLDPSKNFDNLVVGECNKFAITAGQSIANKPGSTLNPLFLFGGPGTGKTHIAQAIGLKIKELHPELVVLYVHADRFKSQYMMAAGAKNQTAQFLAFYQKIDVLIVDDIQEFHSPGTLNTFFNIFNHLHNSNKQLILTSDRPQVELENFEQRLLSRLKWGLSAELKAPDYDTRLSMLHARCQREGATVREEVLEYLATHIKGGFRELEGALISLIANTVFLHQESTVEDAARITSMFVSEVETEVTVQKVEKTVCDYFNIDAQQMLSSSRKRELVQARQIAMYLSRMMTSSSLAAIGEQLGGKNHATVLHACNTITDLMSTDRLIKQYVSDIQRMLVSVQ